MSDAITLGIQNIRLDGGTQPRAAMDDRLIDEYADLMRDGVLFDPIEVYFDGANYWLADGFHRTHAALRANCITIAANVHQGTQRDAVLHSVGANARHGKRRTDEDKRRAVLRLLEDPEWGLWSDREIARRCAVTHPYVAKQRAALTGNVTSERTYTTKHGTVATMNTANIGAKAAEAATTSQDGPLPQVFAKRPAWSFEALVEEMAALDTVDLSYAPEDWLIDYMADMAARKGYSTTREAVLAALPNAALRQREQLERETRLERARAAAAAADENRVTEDMKAALTEVGSGPARGFWSIGSLASWAQVRHADSRELGKLGISPVHLVVTSPPYNVGIEYGEHNDRMDAWEYRAMLGDVFEQCFDVMADGGRIAVVVPFGVGRDPWEPLADVVREVLRECLFTPRGLIVWDKGTTGNRTSWGSFRSPTDPCLRDTTEAIIVAHKGSSRLAVPAGVLRQDGKGTFSPFLESADEFMALACDHWAIAPESAKRIGHPAPFPVALAERLIRFYGYPGCHVLDPFAGSGTTGVAALGLGCCATLVDVDAGYCELAAARCEAAWRAA